MVVLCNGVRKTKQSCGREFRDLVQILFFPPNQGIIVLFQNSWGNSLETYIFADEAKSEKKVPWKFCRRWKMEVDFFEMFLWKKFVGMRYDCKNGKFQICFYDALSLF